MPSSLLGRLRARRRASGSDLPEPLGPPKPGGKSRGVIGGILAMVSFPLLATMLGTVGVPVSGDDLAKLAEQGGAVMVHVDQFREAILPAVTAFVAALVGLLGNYKRQMRIETAGDAVASRGIVGGAWAMVMSVWASAQGLHSAIAQDPEQVAALVSQGKALVLTVSDFVRVATPAVTGLAGSVMLIVGRWQAMREVAGFLDDRRADLDRDDIEL